MVQQEWNQQNEGHKTSLSSAIWQAINYVGKWAKCEEISKLNQLNPYTDKLYV